MLRPVIWIRFGDRYPDLKAERDQFLALDGEAIVGVVQVVTNGPEGARWRWSMTQVHRGRPFPHPRTGTTETRSKAAKALVTSWQTFRVWYGIEED